MDLETEGQIFTESHPNWINVETCQKNSVQEIGEKNTSDLCVIEC